MVLPFPPFPAPDLSRTTEPAPPREPADPRSRWEDSKPPRARSGYLRPFVDSLQRWLDLNA